MATATVKTSNPVDIASRNIPPFVRRYIKVRKALDEYEVKRRELEECIIDWGKAQIVEGNTHGMKLPLSAYYADKIELSLYERKPNETQLLKENLELRQLKEFIEEDKLIAQEKNAIEINKLIKQMEQLNEQIETLSYSEEGQQARIEYEAKLNLKKRTAPPITGVKLKQLG